MPDRDIDSVLLEIVGHRHDRDVASVRRDGHLRKDGEAQQVPRGAHPGPEAVSLTEYFLGATEVLVAGSHSSNAGRRLISLIFLRRRLPSSRARLAEGGGRVFSRGLRTRSASLTSSCNRAAARSLLRHWLRSL